MPDRVFFFSWKKISSVKKTSYVILSKLPGEEIELAPREEGPVVTTENEQE